MTHDLLRNVIQEFNAHVKEVFVNDLREGTFFAKVIIGSELTEFEVDARPSDAIAVAIRFNAPIYVSEKVLNEAGIVADQNETTEEPKIKEPTYATELPESNTGLGENKLDQLKTNLDKAIADEDYEKAARIRDEINQLKG